MNVATSDRAREGPGALKRHAWAAAQPVPAGARWVLFHLADHASPSGLAYPKVTTLAAETRVTDGQAGRHLATVYAAGLIERVRLRRGGHYRGWLFRVLVPGSLPVTTDELPRFVPPTFKLPTSWQQPVP
jgi:hypothetical protein